MTLVRAKNCRGERKLGDTFDLRWKGLGLKGYLKPTQKNGGVRSGDRKYPAGSDRHGRVF